MAQMLDIINVASVTIALPLIMKDVEFSFGHLVTSAYALAYGAFLLVGGRFGDLFGHRRIYIFGVTWFSIWALVNGFAKDPIVMAVGRALQGMGAGFTVPSALAMLTTTYPVGRERNFALAVFGGTGAAGSVVGVLIGGIFGSTIVVLGFVIIPAEKGHSIAKDRRIDYFGIIAFYGGIVCVIFYLTESPASGWASAKTLAPFVVGVALLVTFAFIKYKIDYPIMPLYIWRSRCLVASCLIIVCVSAGLNALVYFSSMLFQNVLGYTPLNTSLTYIVHGVGGVFANILFTKVLAKVRTKIVMIIGWLFFIASGIVFAQTKATSSYWSYPFGALLLNCMGMAPVWLCCQINSVADANDENQGVVGAVYIVAQQLGTPLGIAVANIAANSKNSLTAIGAELLPGYRASFYAVTGISGVGLVLTVLVAANSDPAKVHQDPSVEIDDGVAAEDAQIQAQVQAQASSEVKGHGNHGSLITLASSGEKAELN
ncbi:hypothetical protein BGW39_006152 [Mortierella sp. 14UC]|nr:hypothetical protein BGW39_006152 [Mortierella sp. 14UC]